MNIDRAIVIVLDSVGIGEMPDSAEYGDAGSNTLGHIAEAVGGLNLPNLAMMGLGNIAPITGVEPVENPTACFGKMAEASRGKDTDTGHWEMMGIITEHPYPTYPNGFPDEIIREFESQTGKGILGNKPASGTEIIKELGEEHIRTGKPIVYTSADSVFQIAAHEDVILIDDLYEMCRKVRAILTFPNNVQRVIARPFTGQSGVFIRTEKRKDFSLPPPKDTLLDLIAKSGGEVIGIGKIEDIFSRRGITISNHTTNNPDSVEAIITALSSGQGKLIFANLVDFDMLYGHRNDVAGYARALEAFDSALPRILNALNESDLLIITADHGCDPTTPSTDHSREYVPLLVYGTHIRNGANLGIRQSFCDIAATLAELFSIKGITCGISFIQAIISL